MVPHGTSFFVHRKMPVLKAILNSALFQGVSTVLSPLPLQWDSPMCRLKTRADPAISILTLKQPQRHYTEEEEEDDDEDCFVFVSPSIRKVDKGSLTNGKHFGLIIYGPLNTQA